MGLKAMEGREAADAALSQPPQRYLPSPGPDLTSSRPEQPPAHNHGDCCAGQRGEEEGEEEEEEEEEEEAVLPGMMWMEGDSLAPPCQSELALVKDIIDMANVTDQDVFYDFGCGDGRICRAVAKRTGCHAVGVEIEARLARKFRDMIASEGLEGRVRAVEGDLRDEVARLCSSRPAGGVVVYIYLLPEGVSTITEKLIEAIEKVERCRVVCNTWGVVTEREGKRLDAVEKRAVGHLNNTTLLLYDRRSLPSPPRA